MWVFNLFLAWYTNTHLWLLLEYNLCAVWITVEAQLPFWFGNHWGYRRWPIILTSWSSSLFDLGDVSPPKSTTFGKPLDVFGDGFWTTNSSPAHFGCFHTSTCLFDPANLLTLTFRLTLVPSNYLPSVSPLRPLVVASSLLLHISSTTSVDCTLHYF